MRNVLGKWFYSHIDDTDWTPFAWHRPSHERWMAQLPTQVSSCWGGLTSIDASVFRWHSVAFRTLAGAAQNVSECQLFAADLYKRQLGRLVMAPRARVCASLACEADLRRSPTLWTFTAGLTGCYPSR